MRLACTGAATFALVLAATVCPSEPSPSAAVLAPVRSPAAPSGRASSDEPPAGLTRADWRQIRRSIRDSEYHAVRSEKPGETPALHAANRRQGYRTTFRHDGIEIVPQSNTAAWRLGVSVTGYEGDVRRVQPAEPEAEKDRVEYRRGPVTEWYVNRPGGLEQGFELQPPEGPLARPLVITMAARGDLAVSADRRRASFADRSGATLVRYAGLKAWDADGHVLDSRLESVGREIRLVVQVRAARFPITVDPTFLHEAQLFGHADPIGQPDARFASAVSIHGDTAVVGAFLEDGQEENDGAAYVFVRSGTTWSLQQKLFPSVDAGLFGMSVSISADTIVVGASSVPGGSAFVFTRSGTNWTEQQQLLPSDGASGDQFGTSVSVSGDTTVVGADSDDTPGGIDAGSAYVFVRSGSVWTEQQKLLASDGATADSFGRSVSIAADTVAVGAPRDDTAAGADSGSAYVFVRSGTTWSEQQKLVASDATSTDWLGISVAVDGDTIVAGAYVSDTPGGVSAGSAYVFVRSGATWTEQQKLLASDGTAGDSFGAAVSISGQTAVIAATLDDPGASNAGSAYVFVRTGTTWIEQQKLVASAGAAGDSFGTSVSVHGDSIIAGAPFHDALAGVAYTFVRAGTVWSEEQTLRGSETTAHDSLGASVSLSGDTIVIGAPSDNTENGVGTGSAYIFVRSGATWTQQQKLVPSNPTASHGFGNSVSISGDTAVIAATGADPVGAAHVFVRSGTVWSEQQTLVPSDGTPGDVFGISVSLSGDTAVVGAYLDETVGGTEAGSAYVFVRSGTTWSEQQKLLASDAAPGDLFGGSVSISGNTVVAGARGFPPSSHTGKAYVFVRSGTTWSEQQKLVASDGALGDSFGWAVAVSADTIVVGATGDTTPAGTWAGSAYVFVRSGTAWAEQQKLLASDGDAGNFFGRSVSLSVDTAVVGTVHHAHAVSGGSAYVFVRSGTTWTQRQELLAPDAMSDDWFGDSVSVSAGTIVVGASHDDTGPESEDAGSAHVFRGPEADLAVSKTDGQAAAVPGEPLTYTIVASNAGPAISAAIVSDAMPPALLGVTWTCSASSGSTCAPSGAGDINDTVNLAVGGTATYAVTGIVASGAAGTISNTATVTPSGGVGDPSPGNNSATDTDTLTPESDLAITKTDSADPVNPGDPLTYSVAIVNTGPSDATGVTVVDSLPAGVTFVSSVPGPPTCSFAGVTLTCGLGALAAGGTSAVSISVTVDLSASGILVNTAAVSGNESDPDSGDNTASAATGVGQRDGELSHGTDAVFDLAALPGPVADEDVFRIAQQPYSSYEIVVDATSGDIGAGSGPLVERVAADGTTVLQTSSPIGTGASRSLRWMNQTPDEVEGETIRIRSAGCTTDCGPDDVYRIRAYETTYSTPRFNNSGSQVTVLILQNPTDNLMAGAAYFWDPSGALLGTWGFGVSGRKTLVFDTRTVPGLDGMSGTITVANILRYGDLSGKAVALEPATGFSFDTPLVPRSR